MRSFKITCGALLTLLVASALAPLVGQSPYSSPAPAGPYLVNTLRFVPAVATDFTTKTAVVDMFTFSNKTGAAATVTVKDRSTNCNAAACEFLTTVSIAANSVTVVYMSGGVTFTNGINWQASAANTITASVRGRTTY